MPDPRPPANCAQCGAAIPRAARACPECGADERTGWREVSAYDGLDLPEDAGDDAASRPTPTRVPDRRVNGIRWYWWAIAVAVLLSFALAVLGLR
jgi:hypothetical protein